MEKIAIIGAGFSGLSAACYMAKEGFRVSVYEKNSEPSGRARRYRRDGFTFDMGPTFYWMPDVLEKFFADFGYSPASFYSLRRLDPGYQVYFGVDDSISLPADLLQLYPLFEQYERGSSEGLRELLANGRFNYQVAMDEIVYRPGRSPLELITPDTVRRVSQFLTSVRSMVRRKIKHPQLQQILEFPVLFLGAKPADTPAFYCFMNHADMELGTWHIEGGIYEVILGMKKLAESLGVEIHTSTPVEELAVEDGRVAGLVFRDHTVRTDLVISSADYHYTETLLPESCRNYNENYWQSRVMAPSALLYYIAFDKKLEKVSHHTLFFDTSFDKHAGYIYDYPAWPEEPLFYASFPSQTDSSMAPEGKEAAVILIPVAAGIKDTLFIRERYFREVISRMEKMTGQSLQEHVLFYESFSVSDFESSYNAYKGNAYGLANTLMQTAFLKPKIYNRKLPNLFYTGQLTVPGPGIPPAVISGKIAAGQALKYMKKEYVYG